jgi:two-component system, sensor histidine kinase and response regulator
MKSQSEEACQGSPESMAHGRRVLLVIAHDATRESLIRPISATGAQCSTVDSRSAALEAISRAAKDEKPYDVVLVDSLLPHAEGYQLAFEIKANRDVPPTAVFILIPFGQEALVPENRLMEDLDGVLSKPVRPTELLKILLSTPSSRGDALTSCAQGNAHSSTSAHQYLGQVLLVEDNPVNREVALAMLLGLGLNVDVAENGREAVEATLGVSYDLILMDCQMPDMDGYEATACIRDTEQYTQGKPLHIPIIALTAHALEGDRARCMAAGMDDYLSKPFSREQLVGILERWLSRNPMKLDQACPPSCSPHLPIAEEHSLEQNRN